MENKKIPSDVIIKLSEFVKKTVKDKRRVEIRLHAIEKYKNERDRFNSQKNIASCNDTDQTVVMIEGAGLALANEVGDSSDIESTDNMSKDDTLEDLPEADIDTDINDI